MDASGVWQRREIMIVYKVSLMLVVLHESSFRRTLINEDIIPSSYMDKQGIWS